MLTTTFSYRFALLAFASMPPAFGTLAQKTNVEKQANGVLTHLPQVNQDEPRTLRLQVVSSKIIHVQASPLDSISSQRSMMVVALLKVWSKG